MKVLLVDDDPAIRRIAQLSLERVGRFQVRVAAFGDEAVALALREPPDIILLDMMMPGKDGLTTLAEIRGAAALAPVPVVFMTAKVQSDEVDDYIRKGANGVIRKPFDPMTLPAQVRELLERHSTGGGSEVAR